MDFYPLHFYPLQAGKGLGKLLIVYRLMQKLLSNEKTRLESVYCCRILNQRRLVILVVSVPATHDKLPIVPCSPIPIYSIEVIIFSSLLCDKEYIKQL